jgi:hypothetical protein
VDKEKKERICHDVFVCSISLNAEKLRCCPIKSLGDSERGRNVGLPSLL